MTWFINVSIIKINHLNTEEYECNTMYRKIRSHHQTDGSEPEMVMEAVEIYLCVECEPWHVDDIVHK